MHILVAVCAIIAVTASEDAQVVNVKQDTLGNYDVQYMVDGISKVEQRTADGNVYGGFSFVDPNGIVRKTAYTSGVQGFHAVSPDIPIPVQDTPEVALAKAQHLELLRGAHLANGQVIFPNNPITTLPVEKLIKTEITPTAAVESVPIPRLEKTDLPHQLSLHSLPVTQKLIESVPFVGKVLRTNDITLQALPLGESSPLPERLVQTSAPLERASQIAVEAIPISSEKIVKTELPVVRSSDISLGALPISEKVIQSSVPFIRTGQLAITENVENSVLKSNNIALESIPLSPSAPLLRDSPFAIESAPVSERIIKSQIPVFRVSDLNLKSVPISREYFTHIPAFKSGETYVTHGNGESLDIEKVRLENPFHRTVEFPRSEIVLDPLKFVGNNLRIVRIGGEGFRNILLH